MVENNEKGNGNEFGEEWESDTIGTAYIDGVSFYSKEVQYAEVDGLAIFEGDIVLGTVMEVKRKTEIRNQELRGEVLQSVVITGEQYRWDNCLVPYTIDDALPNQARVSDAIAHWESNTRVRFVLRTDANAAQYPDYVTFRPGNGCSSWVGRQGGQQFITLAGGCSTGSTIHEIGHAVGLWHEHSREDRNAFVTIHWDKIIPGREHNFNQHIADGDDIGQYDYNSIMHYGRSAFSIDGSDTITPEDPTAVIGQRGGLSAGDIAAVNTLCPEPRIRFCPVGPKRPCPAAPMVSCAPGPKAICPPAPAPCQPGPIYCPAAPRTICPPAPRKFCPPAPRILCPPAPRFCPPAPRFCPPAPRWCPPAPRFCPPAPLRGCMAGPRFRTGVGRTTYYDDPQSSGYSDPYGQGYEGYDPQYECAAPYGYDYDPGYAYSDPYGYDHAQDWTATEYPGPNEDCGCQGYDCHGHFDPRSEG